jgi:hypothetical protein
MLIAALHNTQAIEVADMLHYRHSLACMGILYEPDYKWREVRNKTHTDIQTYNRKAEDGRAAHS